jgi:hypothetical protein
MHKFNQVDIVKLNKERMKPQWKQNMETLRKTNEMIVSYAAALIDSTQKPGFRVLKNEELETILFQALKETREEIKEGKVVKREPIFHKGELIEKVGDDPAEWHKRFIDNAASKISNISSDGKKAGQGQYRYYLSEACYNDHSFLFYF